MFAYILHIFFLIIFVKLIVDRDICVKGLVDRDLPGYVYILLFFHKLLSYFSHECVCVCVWIEVLIGKGKEGRRKT